ncbi:hypothetical protein FNL55_05620 [Tardiphaga sp. vice352]|uniref:hypothetical protein n=1 Tax=unclassified Tardiphaga TaxID=2631404 RepID=UPI0011644C27|nr:MULTISPECIES: hypothetical protein [unclassified Tardiphaga]QDM15496.1 hypothetical protein FNL53_05780 [Tardiphaga sp. vice278]QDM20525.1 hypothetical protein FIU28_04700 [Tardiphaga sp. vice154]QDM25653.1 hypothetical protein FNL56_05530 [Tardiphaga sp. vice304]QDM30866.1 hypothetical protein FNL55_05620 [Tardiphaga sp. vice352]
MAHGDHILAHDVLRVLNGARSLPPQDAINALCPFLRKTSGRIAGSDRFADASRAAIQNPIDVLAEKQVATDDDWQEAIETTFSMVNAAD